jgi:methylphosphotriester-DNA--protein-cysteine methyltransferase
MRSFRNHRIIGFLLVLVFFLSLTAIAAEEKAPAYKYVGSAKSNVYHDPSCGSAKKIKPGNLVSFSSAKDAKGKGYRPCKVCKPPAQD